jgi:hypothetical protein
MELRDIVKWKYEHRNLQSMYNIKLNKSKDKISLEMAPDFTCVCGRHVDIFIKDIIKISEDGITCTFHAPSFCVDIWINVSHILVSQFY